MTNPPTTTPARRLLAVAVAVAGLVLVTGACSAGSDKRADTQSEAGSTSRPVAGATTVKDSGSTTKTTAPADAKVLGTATGQLRAGPNGKDTPVALRLDVTSLKRLSGDTVQVRFTITNTDDTTSFEPFRIFNGDTFGQNVGAVSLLDRPNDKKYLSLYDSKDNCLCSEVTDLTIARKQTSPTLYADITAPPRSVNTVAVSMPGFTPIENLAIR